MTLKAACPVSPTQKDSEDQANKYVWISSSPFSVPPCRSVRHWAHVFKYPVACKGVVQIAMNRCIKKAWSVCLMGVNVSLKRYQGKLSPLFSFCLSFALDWKRWFNQISFPWFFFFSVLKASPPRIMCLSLKSRRKTLYLPPCTSIKNSKSYVALENSLSKDMKKNCWFIYYL